ncbi:hypothetical protein ABEB36_002849 [Hypothenemus hampei]|uniref:Protein kinase domain-containing protein n=1 Tax=Hypothenemus hampei TaxID=57062 RepID=A0ABD1F776_HYPHA
MNVIKMRRHKGSSRKRAIEKTEGDSSSLSYGTDAGPLLFHPGSCGPGKCGGETACRNFDNNTFTCVCTHTSLPPTLSGDCPRRIVTQDKIVQQKIPVQPPPKDQEIPSKPNYTTMPITNLSVTMPNNGINMTNIVVPGVVCSIVATIIVAVWVYYSRFKAKRREDTTSPVNLKHSLLIPERYAPNPQYSSCCSTDVPVIRKETLKFLNELGEGCFGKVFKGELVKNAEQKPEIVAIKVLKETASKEAEEDFFREVEIMSTFQHPNILSFIGVVLREGTSCGTINPMMVFEYMEHGDLAEVLRAQKKPSASSMDLNSEKPILETIDLLSVALQIACGMEYLAAQRFVHRDLACRNCLVADGPTVKIADFGMSRDVYTCDYYKIGGSRLLPVRWMSPESVVYGRFTLESDVWSYGVVLWEIYSFGKQPYYGHSNEEVVKLILDGIMLIPPEDSPPLICELMKNCWKTEPKHRINFSVIKDMLEQAYSCCSSNNEVNLLPCERSKLEIMEETMSFRITNEVQKLSHVPSVKMKKVNEQKLRTLPRPPPLPKTILPAADLLDSQGYLLANEIKEPVQYLRTVPG